MGGDPDPEVGECRLEAFEFLEADALRPAIAKLVKYLLAGDKEGMAPVGDGEAAPASVSLVNLTGDVTMLFEEGDRLGGGLPGDAELTAELRDGFRAGVNRPDREVVDRADPLMSALGQLYARGVCQRAKSAEEQQREVSA